MRISGTALCLLVLAACAWSPPGTAPAGLVFLTREGCANTERMRTNLDVALKAIGLPTDYAVIDLATLPDSDARRGYATPTVLYANKDLFGSAEPTPPLPEPA
jgi:hypothetical protein